jgi:hypothetical protein
MRPNLLLIPLTLLLLAAAKAPSSAPRTYLLNLKDVDALKADAKQLSSLKKKADKAAAATPVSVMDKKLTPPSGDRHDFLCYASYWWPDPSKKDGLPYIRKDGQVNPESRNDSDADRLVEIVNNVELLAKVYYLTGDEQYAAAAVKQLRVWYLDPATRMNPNMLYSQIVRGVTKVRGEGILDSRHFTRIVDSIGLLERSRSMTPAIRAGLNDWFKKFVDWLWTSPMGEDERNALNNHGDWYDVQFVTLALFVGKTAEAKKQLEAAKHNRIDVQIKADGSLPLELARTKSFDYCVFALDPLTQLATLGDKLGVDLWRYQPTRKDAGSLRKAIDYMAPYLDPAKPWTHEQIKDTSRTKLVPVIKRAADAYKDAHLQHLVDKFGKE